MIRLRDEKRRAAHAACPGYRPDKYGSGGPGAWDRRHAAAALPGRPYCGGKGGADRGPAAQPVASTYAFRLAEAGPFPFMPTHALLRGGPLQPGSVIEEMEGVSTAPQERDTGTATLQIMNVIVVLLVLFLRSAGVGGIL